ncbi:antihemorrhagic factor cHLP-A-like [Corythoichthys intestinalis]|uniref:antihemorrhagic factor cHLP-A-like n=1 Tax=Corythoichthys intestinalis TaxID=161448 RepID=UPI0025A4D93B|nr:antihemorrhagic factor cHLP-A-like [Corythoichthys intestinalis]XP_061790606.1 antihemorrhagic factor cHLP-A-like [Nerophis lumbriciformis]
MATHICMVLLWFAASLPGLLAVASLPALNCSKDSDAALASLGVKHVNAKHKHGFRFKLEEVQSSKYYLVSGGCHVTVNVKLVQTKCHFTNPKPADQCEVWLREERGAVATCSIEFWVMWGMAKVTKRECTTIPELSNEEMATICPRCPVLVSLDDPTAVEAVHYAVVKFNRENKNPNYFTLMEVAHVTTGYFESIGTVTWIKFALVETSCPRGARNTFVPCTPRCADRANHLFCQTTYYNSYGQLGEIDCELYPPKNPTSYPTGVPEPVCRPLFHQSPEACVCKAQLNRPVPAIHHICPFPIKTMSTQ